MNNKKFIAYIFVALMVLSVFAGVASLGSAASPAIQASPDSTPDNSPSSYQFYYCYCGPSGATKQYTTASVSSTHIDAGQTVTMTLSTIQYDGGMSYYRDNSTEDEGITASYSTTFNTPGSHTLGVIIITGENDGYPTYSEYCGKQDMFTISVEPDPTVTISAPRNTIVSGQNITLKSSVTGGVSPYSYQWYSNGNPISGATSSSLTISPTVNTKYWVNVTDSTGYLSQSNSLIIYVDPYFTLTSSINPSDVGQKVDFTTVSSGGSGSDSYSYTLYDGTSSNDSAISSGTSSSFSYTFSKAGSYLLDYSVSDSDGNTSFASITQVVHSDPSVSISSSVNPVDTGILVEFSSHITGGTPPDSWYWEADGNTFDTQDINVSFSSPGSYTISLTIEDSNGYSSSASYVETVDANPKVLAYANVSETDTGIPVQFTSVPENGTAPFNFTWLEKGIVVSYSENFSKSFSSPGTYTLEIKIRDSFNVSNSANVSVVVNPNPTVSITVTNSNTDANVSQKFSAIISGGTGPDKFSWYQNSILVSTNSSYLFNASVAGNYTILLIIHDKYDRIADSNTIIEKVYRDPSISVSYSHSPIVSESVTIYSHISGGYGNVSLSWSFSSGTASGTDVSYAFQTAGNRTYSISLYQNGYTTTQTFTVYVELKIDISETVTSGNAPLDVSFSAEALGGSSYLYAWNFGNGNTSDSQDTSNVFAAGNYSVTLIVTDSAGVTGSASVLIQAWPAPVKFVYSNNQNITYDFHFKGIPNWDAAGPYNATWNMPNGQVLYGLNVSYYFPTYSKTNDITVDFRFSNTSIYHGDSYAKTIVVDMKPANISVSFSYPDPIPVNTILDLNVSVTAPDTNSFTIDWNVSGSYGTGSAFTYDFSSPGTFYINISISDNLGASTHISKTITVEKLASSAHIAISYTKTTDASIISYNISVHSKYPIQAVQAYLDGSLLTMNMTYSAGNATAGYLQYYTFSLNQRDYSTGDYNINIDVFSSHSQSNSTAVPFTVSSQYSNSAPFNLVKFLGGIDNTIYILLTIGGIIITLVFTRPKPTDIDIDGTVLQAKPGKPVKELKRRK